MAIPVEQELVKHYTVNVADTTPQTVYYTTNGTNTGIDLSVQADGQGLAVFVDNTDVNAVDLTIEVSGVVDLYGSEFTVQLGTFTGTAGEESAFAFGYGLVKEGLTLTVTAGGVPTSAYDAIIAVVPSNG